MIHDTVCLGIPNDIAPRASKNKAVILTLASLRSLPIHVSRNRRLAFQRRANATAQIEAEEAMQAQRAQQIVRWCWNVGRTSLF